MIGSRPHPEGTCIVADLDQRPLIRVERNGVQEAKEPVLQEPRRIGNTKADHSGDAVRGEEVDLEVGTPRRSGALQVRLQRYLEGDPIAGWEARDEAQRRFERCVDRLVGESDGPLAIVSHATVFALYLGLTYDEWAAMPLPAVAVADPRTRRLLEPFQSVDELLAGTAASPGGHG